MRGISRAKRTLLTVLFLPILLVASPSWAQVPGGKVRRLAVLTQEASTIELTRTFMLPELARLGFVQDRNLVVSFRFGDTAQLPELARDILRENPDVVFAGGNNATHAVRELTRTVPIVMIGADPVGQGFAESLARPGGNVTGISILAAELDGKRLEILHNALPQARRIGALMQPRSPDRQASELAMRKVATLLGLELYLFDAAERSDYAAAFAAMGEARAEALLIMATPQFFGDAAMLARSAREARLPTMCEWAEMARAGCLLGYGPDIVDPRRRVANYVARILRGASPGEMPIEQPTRFAFAVNLETARAIGVVLPPSLMLQADEVYE
jgi:putative tryptophan/tyrosine transport system substrate-binding protein